MQIAVLHSWQRKYLTPCQHPSGSQQMQLPAREEYFQCWVILPSVSQSTRWTDLVHPQAVSWCVTNSLKTLLQPHCLRLTRKAIKLPETVSWVFIPISASVETWRHSLAHGHINFPHAGSAPADRHSLTLEKTQGCSKSMLLKSRGLKCIYMMLSGKFMEPKSGWNKRHGPPPPGQNHFYKYARAAFFSYSCPG